MNIEHRTWPALLEDLRSVRGFWYLGTPYTDYELGLESAFIGAATLAGILTALQIEVYSPIAHCHPVALHGGLDPRRGKFWMRMTQSVRRASCGLIVGELAGWQVSRGLSAEREEFRVDGKPVYHINRVVLRDFIRKLRQ